MTVGPAEARWLKNWFAKVLTGQVITSQRKLALVTRSGGGLGAARRAAEACGVHLLLWTDETGEEIIAASLHPFRVIC